VWAGIRLTFSSRYLLGIMFYILALTLLATFLYLQQQQIVAATIQDSTERTQLFANIDLVVNVMVLLIEIFLTSRMIGWLGVPALLMLMPLLNVAGYASLAAAPLLTTLIVFQALRRAVEYAVAKPVREVLFTVVDREQKYKAKNFIDTVVARGGDASSAWILDGLKSLGAGMTQIALIAVPLSLAGALIGWALGRKQENLKKHFDSTPRGQA
jgi:ATP:ADP antiporter, AAA family